MTFNLVMEDDIPNADGKTACVLYAAWDDSNNIANIRWTVSYVGNSKTVLEEPMATPDQQGNWCRRIIYQVEVSGTTYHR